MRSHDGPVRLNSPSAVIASVPYLLGFVPEASLVVVLISRTGRDSAAIRLDLPDPHGSESGDSPATGEAAPMSRLGRLGLPDQVLQHVGKDASAAVMAFGTRPVDLGPCPYADVIDAYARRLVERGITILVKAYVHDGRWWNIAEQVDEDAPSGGGVATCLGTMGQLTGRMVLDEDGIAAAFAFADRGEKFAPNRAALELRYPPCDPTHPPPPGYEALQEAVDRSRAAGTRAWTSRRAALEASVRAAICDGQACVCPRRECASRAPASDAALRIALAEATIREPILQTLCLATDRAVGRRAVQVAIGSLEARARTAFDQSAAPIFAVLAVLHWHSGNGTLATIAAEHALSRHPQNTLASLVAQAVRQGLAPEHWSQILRRFSLAELRRGSPVAVTASPEAAMAPLQSAPGVPAPPRNQA